MNLQFEYQVIWNQIIEIVQGQIKKKILQNILSATFFNKIINPRHFSSQHIGD
jgi:hypothetical protein